MKKRKDTGEEDVPAASLGLIAVRGDNLSIAWLKDDFHQPPPKIYLNPKPWQKKPWENPEAAMAEPQYLD
ncbi:MAG: hypothetical protein IPP55_11565 [Anaerolineales bacterium]|nr:hypothetical protein [Anaerolineales bacterium]